MCHLEGDCMHSMATNDEIFYESMTISNLIADIWKIWHDMDKNIHQEVKFGSYSHPFELGKELEHEEEDKCHESLY